MIILLMYEPTVCLNKLKYKRKDGALDLQCENGEVINLFHEGNFCSKTNTFLTSCVYIFRLDLG